MENKQIELLGVLLEAIKVESFPQNSTHLIQEILKAAKLDLIVDPKELAGGDIAFLGQELSAMGISKVIVSFESRADTWQLNPIKNFGLFINQSAMKLVKAILGTYPEYIEHRTVSNYYGAGTQSLVSLIESPNQQGILIVFKKSPAAAEAMISECDITHDGIQIWLRDVAQKA